MEPVTRRIAIHFYTDQLDECIDFYSRLLQFKVVKDLVLANGDRWATVAKTDNLGVQLHFHTLRTDLEITAPVRLEFSHPDPHSLRDKLAAENICSTDWEYPYTWGIECTDPIGNRIAISCWGDDDDDLKNGYADHINRPKCAE